MKQTKLQQHSEGHILFRLAGGELIHGITEDTANICWIVMHSYKVVVVTCADLSKPLRMPVVYFVPYRGQF
jgi:hypothetical protein